jgi:hypothetical protein
LKPANVIREPLRSAFPVNRALLKGPRKPLQVSKDFSDELIARFAAIQDQLERSGVTWHARTRENSRVGSIAVDGRKQAFTIFLHSVHGYPNIRCVSPIGQIDPETEHERISIEAGPLPIRVAAIYDARFQQYKLTAEADVLLGDRAAEAADRLEDVLIHDEQDVHGFTEDLGKEPHVER